MAEHPTMLSAPTGSTKFMIESQMKYNVINEMTITKRKSDSSRSTARTISLVDPIDVLVTRRSIGSDRLRKDKIPVSRDLLLTVL